MKDSSTVPKALPDLILTRIAGSLVMVPMDILWNLSIRRDSTLKTPSLVGHFLKLVIGA